ncbi:hypothetical protein JA1_004464 [Spathaspora sp. JA1]|nr:hypothetical protein JA1_004464 [Spathaspora sp. JA1]
MSLIYNNSLIYCSETPFDPNNISTDLSFPLSQLYFCPVCQEPRAIYQTSFEINSKFCNNCLGEYPPHVTHCVKNCFCCPDCQANLSITMSDHDNNGKSFRFNCVNCQYKYTTGIIYKPKSLHGIIDDEKTGNPDSFHQLCKLIIDGVLTNTEDTKKTIDKNIELMLQHSMPQPTKQQQETLESNIKSFPRARKLISKTTHRCSHCNNLVLAYSNDKPSSPIINKFAIKFNAIDYLPTITISNLFNQEKFHELKNWNNTNTFVVMIHFMNPMQVKCSINISVPSSFKVTRDINSKITIPMNQFNLGPTSSNLIKTIPSCFLTSNTPTAKSELILRKGDVMYDPPPSTFEEIEENLDSFVERGVSWCSIPVIINLSSEVKQKLDIGIL